MRSKFFDSSYQWTEVSTETDISIVFNQPIAPLTTVDELDAQGFAISITPDFPHRFRLAGTSILQIQGQMPADTFSDGIELKKEMLLNTDFHDLLK